jgi:hypothetical protein
MQTVSARALLALVIAAALSVRPGLADDLNPPDYRGRPLTTAAEWDFDADAVYTQPDGEEVALVVGDSKPLLDGAFPPGQPHPSCRRFGDTQWSTLAGDGGWSGGPAGTGIIACNIPNWLQDAPEKQLRIQVTYSGPAPYTNVFAAIGVPGTGAGVNEVFIQRVADTSSALPSGASYFYEDWRIFPNPDWEQVAIYLHPGTFLHQLVVDTYSGQLSGPVSLFRDDFEIGSTFRWSDEWP